MEKGKLKIFFGYVAGIGKTYAMLKEAHKLKEQGVDVVIGYFEPHDRKDTMALVEGLEALPLKEFEYRGIKLKEFDVDAAIERKPEYILVDELAHTNVSGSKNTKRYLDVIELLNNGINVYTTLNVQHLESLNDIIDSKTDVNINERIPDDIFALADEIKIIDLEPPLIIERMKQGKIYKREKIDLALNNFFRVDNLFLLRELTMRTLADKIQIESHNGVKQIKFLVLISPSPSSSKNIRVTARMAKNNHANWCALYVETNSKLSDEGAKQLKAHMELVHDLGGETFIKYSDDVVETIAEYVKVNGVTNLIIGKTWESLNKKVPFENKIIALLPDVEILIVTDHQGMNTPKKSFLDYLKGFSRHKYLEKFRLANKTLDMITALDSAVDFYNPVKSFQEFTKILSRSFSRSVQLKIGKDVFECVYQDEDTSFFDEVSDAQASAWAYQNLQSAGKSTNTLRNAKGIYFPLLSQNEVVGVVGFSCLKEKFSVTEKLLFFQIKTCLSLNIAFLRKKKE